MGISNLLKPNVLKMKEKRDIKGLMKALNYGKDAEVQRQAITAIGEIGEARAVDTLIRLLNDTKLCKDSIEALGKIKDRKAFEPLVQLAFGDTYLADEAAVAAVRCDPEMATGVFLKSLEDQAESVRHRAAKAVKVLMNIGWKPESDQSLAKATNVLVRCLTDLDENVRLLAAEALINIGWKPDSDETLAKSVEVFVRSLEDQNKGARSNAAYALEMLGWKPDTDQNLVNFLMSKGYKTQSEWIRLGKIVGIGPILEELREGYGDDQIEIAKILGEIGDPKAADALIGLLKSLEDIRCRRASRRDWPLINETKVAVILALGKLKDGRAVEALLYEYGGEQSRVVETALKESGIEAVVRKLTDAKRSIRDVAAQVLDHFGWQPQIDAERAQYLIAKEEWEDLARLGKAAVEPLIQVLKTEPEIDERGVESRQKASLLLAETGDRRAAEVVLHSLFASKRLPTFYGSEMRESWTSVMTRLFGDYTSMILRAALFTISGKTQTDAEGKYGKITYDLSESDRALQELCEIQTQVASNILHEISGRTDVKIRTGWGYDPHEAYGRFDCESDLNLEVQRKKAIEELSRRGNPRFDPTAYLKAAAWKL